MKRLVVFSILLVLAGALSCSLGLTSPADCVGITRASESMECYHLAAVTVAHMQDKYLAQQTCEKIWTEWAAAAPDIAQRAELESNNCFYDIAKILKDPDTCEFISNQPDAVATKLAGHTTTKYLCIQEAKSLAALHPENYFQTHPDSLCNALFVLPLVLVGAVFAGRRLES